MISGVDVTRTYRRRAPSFTYLLHRIPLPGEWAMEGACRGWPVEWWFPRREGKREQPAHRAREICAGCPVRIECEEYAMAHSALVGLWGGLTSQERRRARGLEKLRRAS